MAPRIFKLCAGLAAALVLVSFIGLPTNSPAPAQHSAPEATTAMHTLQDLTLAVAHPASLADKDPSMAEQVHASAGADDSSIRHHQLWSNTKIDGWTARAPARPFTSVPASRENGHLSAGCQKPKADDERKRLLQMLPAAIPAAKGGRPGCLQETAVLGTRRSAASL